MNKWHIVQCAACNKEFEISDSTFRRRIVKYGGNVKFYCPDCRHISRVEGRAIALSKLTKEEIDERNRKAAERARQQWASYDEDKRKEISKIFSNAQRQRLVNMSPEEREAFREKRSEASRIGYANKSEEDKSKFKKECAERMTKRWSEMSDEKRDSIRAKQSVGLKRYINSLSDEELKKRNERISSIYANLSDERKTEVRAKISRSALKRWNSMTEEEQTSKMNKIHDGFNEYFSDEENKERFSEAVKSMHKNLPAETKQRISRLQSEFATNQWKNRTPEERQRIYKNIRDGQEAWYKSLTDEQRAFMRRQKFITAGINKFNGNSFKLKFRKFFNDSCAKDFFFCIEEVPAISTFLTHCWDYGIFDQNDELVIVVDLDGAYFHADACDYDGIRSREEYDEKRWLSIPDGVVPFIIQERNFDKCFNYMLNLLRLTHDEYVDKMFNEFRNMPFPDPHYTDDELIKSWNELLRMNCNDKYHNSLSINNREGDRIILNFHPSIYRANIVGNVSPADVWKDDKLLKDAIRNHTIYQSHLNHNKILQGFNVSDVGRRVLVFSAGRAKLIINKYLSEYDTVFDPFSGFSGRMLGAFAAGKRYIGQDISEIRVRESNNILEFLREKGVDADATVIQADILRSHGEYPCLFTSPPTMDEEFIDVPASSLTCDEWIDVCMERFKCDRYVFVVDKTDKYANEITDVINIKASYIQKPQYVIDIQTHS